MREQRVYGERREWRGPEGYGIKVDEPVAGYYKVKLGRGTVLRAVHLVYGPPNDPITGEELDRSWRWQALIDDGGVADFEDVWPLCAGDPITEAEWRQCKARTAWAREHAPGSAYARPGRRIDPLSTSNPLPF